MPYQKQFFDPPEHDPYSPAGSFDAPAASERPVYVYTERIVLAVNVALACERPLLISGPPGSGKSTLARHVAEVLSWRYLKQVVTSRTQVDDLLAGFDALRRLNDAQTPGKVLRPDAAYVEPGVLWWAFDPESAARRGLPPEQLSSDWEAPEDPTRTGSGPDAIVLLDEIDKADPDVPNDLLEPLDRRSFQARHVSAPVAAKGDILMVVATNGERELPPAFLRRCVHLELERMSKERLIEVAQAHFGPGRTPLYEDVAEVLRGLQDRAREQGMREPSTAEYLDTVRACVRLGIEPGAPLWTQVMTTALWKQTGEFAVPVSASPALAATS